MNDLFFYCISGTKKKISNDEGEVDNEPIAKKSKHDKHYAELEGNASDSDDEPLSKLKISNNGETGGCENFIPQQQRQIGQLSPTQENTNTSVFAEQIISAQEQNVNNEGGKLVLNSCLSSYTDNKTTLKDSTNVSISAINSSNTTDENTITTVVAEQIISAQEQNVNNKGEELVLNSCLTTDTDKVYTTLKDFTNVSKSVSNSSDTTLKTPLKPLISLFPNFDEDPSFYGLQDHAQSALDHDYHVQVVAEPYENMNFFQSSMDSCTYTSKEQEIIQDPMPNLTCQTLQPPDQEFSKHQTLSEQLDFIEKQNGTILEAQNIAFEQISNISISMDTVQSNLQYLINLIKCRSTVKSSNKQTPVTPRGDRVHLEKTLDINCQIPVVVRSTINPENIRIGNSNFEMSYDKYCKILQRNSNLPTTFAVKLLSVLFTDNELFERNVTGRVIHDNVQRSKLNPIKLDAIENQLRLQFPQFMDSKENNDKIWIAINGKCRKTTAKLNKTVFSDPI